MTARSVAVRRPMLDVMTIDPLRDQEAVQLSHSGALVGADGRSLRREHAAGNVLRLRRGVYASGDVWHELSDHRRYLMRMRAVTETRDGDAVFGFESAAAIWGLPIIGRWPETVHVFPADARRRTTRNGVTWHKSPLHPDDVVELDGVLVTSRLRTLLDLARSSTFISAVTTVDAALAQAAAARGGTANAELLRAHLLDRLAECGSARGTRRALQAINFSSPLAGSPGESASRVTIHLCRFPAPVLQFPVVDRHGTLWHADVGWPEHHLLGEFDGFTKYTRSAYTHGQPIEEIVWAEKKREDLMRAATGFGMTRWLWDDALRAPLLIRILTEAGLPRG
jgi:predicted transcriptional regulator of viral defense system